MLRQSLVVGLTLAACDGAALDPGRLVTTDAAVIEEGSYPESDAGSTHSSIDAGAATEDAASAPPEIDPAVLAICRRVSPAYDEACVVDQEHITIDVAEPRPDERHLFPGVAAYNMNGWEWWQKWPGGNTDALFDEELATDLGLKCSVASALRFAAIMLSPPEDLVTLLEESNWEGRFFNWNDDYSEPTSSPIQYGARTWAWRTYLIKWISVTHQDGGCDLPTLDMLEETVSDCLATSRANAGEIEGCGTW